MIYSRLRFMVLIALVAALLFSACANPTADKPKAVIGEAGTATSSPVAGEKYRITTENSKIEFIGAKVTGQHHGEFKKFSGTIDFSGAPEKGRVSITIDSHSIETDTPDLTKPLK